MNTKRKRTRRHLILKEIVLRKRITLAKEESARFKEDFGGGAFEPSVHVLRIHLRTVRRRLQGVYQA